MLCTLGDLVEEVVVWLERDPERGADSPVRITRRAGGGAATVAAAVARAGGRVRFVGQVGDDPLAERLLADLTAAGVELAVTRRGRSGTTVVLVDASGELTHLHDRAASSQLSAVPDDALDDVAALHVPCLSFSLEPLATTAYELVGDAIERGVRLSVDSSSTAVLRDFGVTEFLELVANVSPRVLFCGRDEATLLGVRERGVPGARLTVVHCAEGPARLHFADGTVRSVAPPEGLEPAPTRDVFVAGFLQASLEGLGPETAARRGHETAGQARR